MKPLAPSTIRSEFQPIATNVPGTEIGEHLPYLAQQADKFTIIRSMTHTDFEHGTAAYTALTGHPHPIPGTNTTARPDDFPTYGSLTTRLAPSSKPVPDAVVLGPVLHQGARPPVAGQNGGFLGPGYDPFRIAEDPNQADFHVDGITLPAGVAFRRFRARRALLASIETSSQLSNRERRVSGMHQLYGRAFGFLGSEKTRKAFELERERPRLRDGYGRTRFGQTLLLSRRLVEAGVPMITVNWSKLNSDQWDTHKNNYPRLKKLLPPFDRALAAFLNDLAARGLLGSTLVVCLGEFGRTPKINKDAGRDHWPDCYSVVVAGGGIENGRVYGKSNKTAAYPTENGVAPWDLSATMYHLLGIDPARHVYDSQGRQFTVAPGSVVTGLL